MLVVDVFIPCSICHKWLFPSDNLHPEVALISYHAQLTHLLALAPQRRPSQVRSKQCLCTGAVPPWVSQQLLIPVAASGL